MRFPYLANAQDLITTWSRMITQYERDYEQLDPHIEDFTLTSSSSTTVLYDVKIRPTSVVTFSPKTLNAAAGLASLYYATPVQGSATITHANNAQTDRIYRVTIMGS